jgi:hypothetical protein
MLLTKLPIPAASEECDPDNSGFDEVPQHTPLADISAPPSLVITPPVVTELIVIFVTSVVVRVGITGSFLQLSITAIPTNKQIKIKCGTILFILTNIN